MFQRIIFAKKKIMRYLTLLLFVVGCSSAAEEVFDSYGEEINPQSTMQVSSFVQQVDTTAQNFKIEGTVEEVCQMKGCWMTLRNEEGTTIRVTFKDYGFFVPKDISGKKVIVEGIGKSEYLGEDEAKHFADDAGKEYDDSMRSTYSFVAKGVLVEKS